MGREEDLRCRGVEVRPTEWLEFIEAKLRLWVVQQEFEGGLQVGGLLKFCSRFPG